jgi:tetratricopeptide (TPR) repeat protein
MGMNVSIKHALWAPALLAALVGCGGSDAVLAQRGPTSSQGSLGKIAIEDNRSAWQKMKDSVASTLGSDDKPEVKEPDELSLSKTPALSPQLCVRCAQLHERSGNHAAAAEQYQRALQADPNHLDALLGYARMNDRLGRAQQALPLYEEAARKHAASATAHNDWAICLTNSGKPDAAVAVMTKAVNLQPANPLYRNNLATILVRLNRGGDALQHLSAVHPPAVAHYNLGYLFRRAGNTDAARQHFAQAVQADPSFAPAKHYLAELGGTGRPSVAQAPTGPAVSAAPTAAPR